MKKITILAALALLVSPLAVSAQTASGTVNASATILANLNVANVADLDFGSLAAGAGAALTPGVVPGAGTLGVLQIDHSSNVNVSAALPAGLTLVGGSGTEPTLPVTFSCGYSAAASGAIAGAATACSALPARAGNGDGTVRTTFVQVGGSIASGDTTNRIPGTYTGALVFTVNAVY